MADYTVQDLFVWADKMRQSAESRSRAQADVTMLEQAVSNLDGETLHSHHSGTQLDFAKSELARVEHQCEVAWGMIKKIVKDMDGGK